jgi:hypothetical protein
MSATYMQTWRCARCEVSWAKAAGLIPCWFCGSDRHVGPGIDECVAGGILELPDPAMPRRGRGTHVNLVIIDEVHEWATEALDGIVKALRLR